jgi:hypothetical protein
MQIQHIAAITNGKHFVAMEMPIIKKSSSTAEKSFQPPIRCSWPSGAITTMGTDL